MADESEREREREGRGERGEGRELAGARCGWRG
jgi:hypothetical protein